MAQTDVTSAFYRIAAPTGMEEYFRMPPVKCRLLRELGVEVPLDSKDDDVVTPLLLVLAMGFSWALYFCQRLVEACAAAAGLGDARLLLDRRRPPVMSQSDVLAAIYVDGVCVVGNDEQQVLETL